MSAVDLTPVWQSAVSLAALTLTTFGGIVLAKLNTKYHLEISADRQAAWNAALENAVQYGAQASLGVIASKGWDHVESHDAVLNSALSYLSTHVPQTLKSVGLSADLNDPANKAKISEAIMRAMPSGLALAASSPATPPATVATVANLAREPEPPMHVKIQ